MHRIPRSLSLVKFNAPTGPPGSRRNYPSGATGIYVFFGEIPNVPGHYIVADQSSGRIYSGYHTEHFGEFAKEET